MAAAAKDTTSIKGWHAHVYDDAAEPESRARVTRLRDWWGSAFRRASDAGTRPRDDHTLNAAWFGVVLPLRTETLPAVEGQGGRSSGRGNSMRGSAP